MFHGSSGDVPLIALVRELVAEATRTAADLDISAVITRYQPAAVAPG
jgi:hypothetical protein